MSLLLLAIVAGLVAGFAAGGRPSNAARRPVRATGALAAGVVFQAAPHLLSTSDSTGLVCVLVSYALLIGFAVANFRLIGMPVVLFGLVLNAGIIVINDGMPVRTDAILSADRDRRPEDIAMLHMDAKRHVATSADHVTVLGDALPLRPVREVVSFGDLVLAAGMANVVFRLLKPHAEARRRGTLAALPAG